MSFPHFRLCVLACALLAGAIVPAVADEEGFVPLFDGKSLDGWKKVGGGATYHVEGDTIVGEVGPGANTFLRTEKTYGDFILKLDMKLDVPGNSGIQFRSHQKNGDGQVFGYQCEIDPSSRAWTAGLYDEGRRGWLYPLTGHPAAQKAFRLDDWNAFVIEARGPVLKTTLNGVPCADLIDPMDLEGFIALQVHAGKEGRIRWKNVRLRDLGRTEWRPLWDGKTSGSQVTGGGDCVIEVDPINGVTARFEARPGRLAASDDFADCAVRLQFKPEPGKTGLSFEVENWGTAGVKRAGAEIDLIKNSGGLFETDGRGWGVPPKPEDVKTWFKPDAWNTLTVIAHGRRIVVHINGHKAAEVRDDPGRAHGKIALQLHSGRDLDFRFQDFAVLEHDAPQP